MIEFEIKEGKLIIRADLLTVPILRRIYERDTSKDKKRAEMDLLFIYHMAYHKSPYATMDDLVKEDHVKKKVYGDSGFKPDQMVQQGIDEFVRLAITADDRILYDIDKQIDKIRLWIMTREIDDKTGDAVVSGIIKLDGVLESRDKIKARIEKNVATGAVTW